VGLFWMYVGLFGQMSKKLTILRFSLGNNGDELNCFRKKDFLVSVDTVSLYTVRT